MRAVSLEKNWNIPTVTFYIHPVFQKDFANAHAISDGI